jgi:hypothetical protein
MTWIKCSDSLPEQNQFLGLCEDGSISCFEKDDDYFMTGGWGICGYCGGSSLAVLEGVKESSKNIKKITHWMPLPAPPEDE